MREIELSDSFTGSLKNEQGKVAREFTRHWAVDELFDYTAAETKAKTLAPETFNGHTRQDLQVKPIGDGWWEIFATYKTPDTQDPEDQTDNKNEAVCGSISFDTTGASERVYQAYYDGAGEWGGESAYARGDEFAPEQFGAINVSGDSVQGIDKVVPQFSFSEAWVWPIALVTDNFLVTLHSLTGTINANKFRLFEPGECLFLGASADWKRNDSSITVNYSFRAMPNRNDFKVGQVEVTSKKGWQYLWVRYEDHEANSNLIKRPKYVYVDDVYESKDFAPLGIGGSALPDIKPKRRTSDVDLSGWKQPKRPAIDWGT